MLTWMIYVIAVSLLLGYAAFAAERAARLKKATTRWYWFAAIIASLLIPTVIASVSVQLPNIVGHSAAQKIYVLRDATSIPISPQSLLVASGIHADRWPSFDGALKNAWGLVSALMLLVLVVHGVQLYRRQRAWRKGEMTGAQVYVALDVGPAVVGFLRPEIVVPAWLEQSAPHIQSSVIAHERSHLNANDPQLFTISLCLLIFMPWNLPLWWQLRRLRHAIEVDCDARVLKGGTAASHYGETLIAVGARQSAFIGAVAAMAESPSFLEQRIAIMTSKPKKLWQLTAAALTGLSLALVAVAAQVSPPNAGSASTPQEITLDTSVLDRYVGQYMLAGAGIFSVTRAGSQLSTQLTGQPSVEIYPTSATHFFLKVVPASLDFIVEGDNPATAVVLHQGGHDITMTRVDASTAQQFNSNLAARMQTNTPSPGTEAALRHFIESSAAGSPDFAALSTPLGALVKQQQSSMEKVLSSLGKLQSIEFQGVGAMNYDSYVAKFEKGSLSYRIQLDPKGIITMLAVLPYP
jgi:bla regulator protein blaR1